MTSEDRDPTLGVSFIRSTAETSVFVLRKVPDKPGFAAQILTPIAEAGVAVDLIVQNSSAEGYTDFSFTIAGPKEDADKTEKILQPLVEAWGIGECVRNDQIAKISLIGERMRTGAGVASRVFQALADKGINIEAISTSSIRITLLVDSHYEELAVRTLREAFVSKGVTSS